VQYGYDREDSSGKGKGKGERERESEREGEEVGNAGTDDDMRNSNLLSDVLIELFVDHHSNLWLPPGMLREFPFYTIYSVP